VITRQVGITRLADGWYVGLHPPNSGQITEMLCGPMQHRSAQQIALMLNQALRAGNKAMQDWTGQSRGA
jgi:hypothetical protein